MPSAKAQLPSSSQLSTPFKGESFPSYVVQRVPRATGTSTRALLQQSEPANGAVATVSSSGPLIPPASSAIDLLTATAPAKCNSMSPLIKCQSPQQRKGAADSSSSLRTRSRSSFQRPSLSDQLKTISQGAQDITLHLNTTYKLQRPPLSTSNWLLTSPVLLQATTIGMTVGKLECRFPCPVHFAQDHCSYLFQHPYEAKEVRMVMFYRDMTQMQMNVREKCFQFRINHPLEQFGDDYKPENPQHAIKIVLATISEAQKVKQFIGDHKLWFPR